jgi:hypothetical protein
MGDARKHAIELGAVPLGSLLTSNGFSSIFAQLTSAQINQLQRYLDAQVIDPDVNQRANLVYRKGTKVYGSLVYTDPETTRKADRVRREYIPVHALDDTVRLDLSKVLDPKALAPTTDNPDEADYLETVHKWLDRQGVWLRIAPTRVRNPDDRSQWIFDGKHFAVWLSLGPRGDDAIPTKTGRIDRQALISTQVVGANYWRKVDEGPVESALDRQVQSLRSQIEDGQALHIEMTKIRNDAAIGVVAISDVLGGADFPNFHIWDGPNTLLISAMNIRNAGRTWGANLLLTVAAVSVRNAANLLNTYIAKTTSGAARSVKVLKVARTAGKVAEVGLAIATGAALVTGAGAASGVAAADTVVDAAAEKELGKYIARNPELANELNSVKLVPGPRGTVLGNVKGTHSAGYGQGFRNW